MTAAFPTIVASQAPQATWTPSVCYYHANCMDGFAAAWAVYDAYQIGPPALEFIPVSYGAPPPVPAAGWPGARIIVVDFSFKPEVIDTLLRSGIDSMVLLDHHKTAEADLIAWSRGTTSHVSLQGFTAYATQMRSHGSVAVAAHFDMHKSGARMAWEFCNSTPLLALPPLLARVEDRDLWKFEYTDTTAIYEALVVRPWTFSAWSALVADPVAISTLTEEGGLLLRQRERYVADLLTNAIVEFDAGANCLVALVNAPYAFASELGNRLLQLHPSVGYAAVWHVGPDNSVRVSLRSDAARRDVSEIARRRGGGGHRNAAGYALPAGSGPKPLSASAE